ncbi:hypothetical protein ACMD2_25900 [Ananas comosus]|uniref:Uncharacterized protein n=1 Tax=Ananas comosus TaxID=4615 RepID=A0A199VWJ3_ANACO|nr:hypothetical protein ACMD2_25900 [Ananas comosus]
MWQIKCNQCYYYWEGVKCPLVQLLWRSPLSM